MQRDTTSDIVGKLWNLCNILKDDGVTYHQYVTELTYLLFLKMMQETSQEKRLMLKKPAGKEALKKGKQWETVPGTRWADLVAEKGLDRLRKYEDLLRDYGRYGAGDVLQIYANSATTIKKPVTLSTLVTEIDKLNWYSVGRDDLGDLYEGLLEKNANEKKSGAGQYFTPRELIRSMVRVTKPTLDDVIQDPAAGTGGFLIAANNYLRAHNDFDSLTEAQQKKHRTDTFYGMEHVQDTHRLALMNLLLHGIESGSGAGIQYGDSLSPQIEVLPRASLILTNPPFGTKKGGGLPTRTDFTFQTSNKQFAFLQHVYKWLVPGGRAAVVLPDNVLFESNVGADIRRDLMDKCRLHTILRLPTGIFYAQGVKTNVLFFTRGKTEKGNTKEVWVYDLRANMPQFGKRTPLTDAHFADFEKCYGSDPLGSPATLAKRKDLGPEGRFRKFTREEIAARGDSLDLSWLKDSDALDGDALGEPVELARAAMADLTAALEGLTRLVGELERGK